MTFRLGRRTGSILAGVLVVLAVAGCGPAGGTPSAMRSAGPATGANTGTGAAAGSATADTTPTPPPPPGFESTGSMADARGSHTSTTLQDGRILVTGGWTNTTPNNVLASAELFDPKTGKFSPAGALHEVRTNHTATLLADGRVLIAGGFGGANATPLASAELFDPKTGKFTPTGSMVTGRFDHTATLLRDGRVLITGGSNDTAYPEGSAEIYDPSTGTFLVAGALKAPRFWQTATLLPSGLVLVAGGYDGQKSIASAELYDPVAAKFTPSVVKKSLAATLTSDVLFVILTNDNPPLP